MKTKLKTIFGIARAAIALLTAIAFATKSTQDDKLAARASQIMTLVEQFLPSILGSDSSEDAAPDETA